MESDAEAVLRREFPLLTGDLVFMAQTQQPINGQPATVFNFESERGLVLIALSIGNWLSPKNGLFSPWVVL